ncbi:MAG: hypothetical protein K2N07_01850 [Desulfovibrio sp.]|nr:hypothetical protein [Desulfovibrio sp.]
MSAIDEARRQEFGAVLDEADSDPQTTGVFLYLLAPRRGGVAREAVLCAGNLPVGAVLARMIPISRKRLEQHAAAEASSR